MTSQRQDILEKRPKDQALLAIILGLLTFISTPIVALVIASPLLFFGNIPETFNPIIILAKISGLQGIGGFFAAQFIFLSLLAVIGDFAAALISLRACQSIKLAALTFISAIIFQIVAVFMILPATIKQSQRFMESGIDRERQYKQYAQIGDIDYEVYEQYSDREITNLHPEYGPIYKKLEIVVPISVSQPGIYAVAVEYRFAKEKLLGNTRMKEIRRTFEAKDHTVKIEFVANEAGGHYGYWSPNNVDGSATVQLNYLASKKEIVENLKFESSIEKNILEQFIDDERLDEENRKAHTVRKFIEIKQTQFY